MKTLNFDLPDNPIQEIKGVKKELLQGTQEWREMRKGRFNSSKFSDLMATERGFSKKSWSDEGKLHSFGKTAIKYIFQVAMERKTGKSYDSVKTWQMDYGNRKEQEVRIHMKEKENTNIRQVSGFEILEGIAGTSPDGLTDDGIPAEIKCPPSINGYYERTQIEYNEKHCDFWQHQGQMIGTGKNILLYIVANPPADPFDEDEWVEVDYIKTITGSLEHQEALLKRIKIANDIVERWLKEKKPFQSYFE